MRLRGLWPFGKVYQCFGVACDGSGTRLGRSGAGMRRGINRFGGLIASVFFGCPIVFDILFRLVAHISGLAAIFFMLDNMVWFVKFGFDFPALPVVPDDRMNSIRTNGVSARGVSTYCTAAYTA